MENSSREVADVVGRPAATPLLLGQSPAFVSLRNSLPTIARAQRTTLVVGPTGAGKDLVAQGLHQLSVRRDRPFVAVHCAALPDNLVEAEMFGHCRGAFTGATQSRAGLIRTASQGTLFLDEIDSLPPSAQAKLLRFLETGEYRAVGSDRVEHSDAWIIAATNQDLGRRVAEGTFRADLLYRLAVVQMAVPSLQERSSDIHYLAEHFLHSVTDARKRFSDDARSAMSAHSWPGNVRELKHRIESAALLTEADVIDSAALGLRPPPTGAGRLMSAELPTTFCLPPMCSAPPVHDRPDAPSPRAATVAGVPLERELWTLIEENGLTLSKAVGVCEQLLVQAALRAEGNNRTRAAGRLGIHVRTIFKKLIVTANG